MMLPLATLASFAAYSHPIRKHSRDEACFDVRNDQGRCRCQLPVPWAVTVTRVDGETEAGARSATGIYSHNISLIYLLNGKVWHFDSESDDCHRASQ